MSRDPLVSGDSDWRTAVLQPRDSGGVRAAAAGARPRPTDDITEPSVSETRARERDGSAPSALVHGRDSLSCSLIGDFLSEQLQLPVLGAEVAVDDVLRSVERLNPDLVVSQVDSPPTERSRELTKTLRDRHPDVEVVVFGSQGNPTTPEEYRDAGASRFLTVDATLDDLAKAIREVLAERG